MWDKLLKAHVSPTGVNYADIRADSANLNRYLSHLATHVPGENWSENETRAYWINAYNAFTVKLIVDHYPLSSIKDLNKGISIPTVSTIWAKKWFTLGDEEMSLDNIEHGILRKHYDDPRIHAVLNCASVSCPPLRAEAFVAARLDAQLDDQARVWVNDKSRNQLSKKNPKISKIFMWYKGDFSASGGVIAFINRYASTPIPVDADIDYLDYDWNLNEVK